MGRGRRIGSSVCWMLLACGHSPVEEDAPAMSPGIPEALAVALPRTLTPQEAEEAPAAQMEQAASDDVAAPQLPEVIETRRAIRTHSVYDRAGKDGAPRGRIAIDAVFAVHAKRAGPDCKDEWGLVGPQGWTCLDRTEVVDEDVVGWPILLEGKDLPFVYARHRRHRSEDTPAIPVYRNLYRMRRGDAPVEELAAHGSYAFVERKWNGGNPALITAKGRAVPAADMIRFRPSEFEGRDLVAEPLPAGTTLAWALYAELEVRAEAKESSRVTQRLERHDSVLLMPEPVQARGQDWYALSSQDPRGVEGWVRAADVGRFVPEAFTHAREPGELTVDVDLEHQSLSVWRDDQPIFATLISSGRAGDRTPRGLYRVRSKWAFGKMESRPGSDEPYFVEAVPWAMYFSGRYALHAAYWHNRFGQRMSHGCINLSPRDARRVFELTTPTLPPGWLLVHEHASDPGVVLRIRRGGRSVPDRRDAVPAASELVPAEPE